MYNYAVEHTIKLHQNQSIFHPLCTTRSTLPLLLLRVIAAEPVEMKVNSRISWAQTTRAEPSPDESSRAETRQAELSRAEASRAEPKLARMLAVMGHGPGPIALRRRSSSSGSRLELKLGFLQFLCAALCSVGGLHLRVADVVVVVLVSSLPHTLFVYVFVRAAFSRSLSLLSVSVGGFQDAAALFNCSAANRNGD